MKARVRNAPAPAEEPRVSPKVERAIALLASGEAKNQADAARMVGLKPASLCRSLRNRATRWLFDEAIKNALRDGLVRAPAVLCDLLAASSESVRLEACKALLALGGYRLTGDTPAVNVNIEGAQAAGYTIILGPRDRSDASKPVSQSARLIDDSPVIDVEPATDAEPVALPAPEPWQSILD